MHQTAKIVPLVHATKPQAIAYSEWHPLCKVDVVCNQQGLTIPQAYNESLMPGIVIVVGQQAPNQTAVFYPVACISLRVTLW